MSQIAISTISITTTGNAGQAVGSGTTIPINGFLLDVFINYNAAAPATTDVTISDPTFGNILVNSNSATDVWLAPRKATCDAAGADNGLADLIPLNAPLTIALAQCDALTAAAVVTVRFLIP